MPRFAIAPLGLTEGSTKFRLKGWKCYLKKLQCIVWTSYRIHPNRWSLPLMEQSQQVLVWTLQYKTESISILPTPEILCSFLCVPNKRVNYNPSTSHHKFFNRRLHVLKFPPRENATIGWDGVTSRRSSWDCAPFWKPKNGLKSTKASSAGPSVPLQLTNSFVFLPADTGEAYCTADIFSRSDQNLLKFKRRFFVMPSFWFMDDFLKLTDLFGNTKVWISLGISCYCQSLSDEITK